MILRRRRKRAFEADIDANPTPGVRVLPTHVPKADLDGPSAVDVERWRQFSLGAVEHFRAMREERGA